MASIRAEGILGVYQTKRITVPRLYRDVMNGGVAGENRFKNFVNQNKTTNPVRIRRVHVLDDLLPYTDFIITNGVLAWIATRLVKRVDTLDERVDDHATRLQLTEHQLPQQVK